jgi:hypothetical protein
MSAHSISLGKDQGKGLTSEVLFFNSRRDIELFHFSQESRQSLGPTHLHIH